MKNINKILIIILVFLIASFLYSHFKNNSIKPPNSQNNNQPEQNVSSGRDPVLMQETAAPQKDFVFPIDRAEERVTKKPFGIFITKQNSPVQPERFSGYHTGTDFETFPEEQNSDVSISAITNGKVIEKRWISGYGGVLIESAVYDNSSITIVYGHLNLSSINKKTGDSLSTGEKIGILGRGYSQETDGERKHLHLGIHKGSAVDVRGYVNNKVQLRDWFDSKSILNF
ncbi:MAG: M23 family metallopeptidase [Parcubacteria group bacterium]|jgi:murein DD-endopeptidase MepM/ murein hydrolase activator NlpD